VTVPEAGNTAAAWRMRHKESHARLIKRGTEQTGMKTRKLR
jgi:hypothetical protein